MSVESEMRERLILELEPTRLDVINESELHAGHRGSPGTGNSHFRVLIVSKRFDGVSRVNRHRMVNDLMASFLKGGVHALALSTYAPGEPIL
jgi:BolA family transcriptional regulator, general stress-responsive regulator